MKASPFMGITDAVKKISGWLDAQQKQKERGRQEG